MDYSINTKPLLESSDSEEDVNSNLQQEEAAIVNEKPLFKPTEPVDKYNMAYIIFYLLGVVTLLPWNFFITADDYWLYKFRDVATNTTTISKRTPLQADFTPYLSVASSVPNIAFLIVNTALNNRLSLNKRINGSLIFMLILFIITTIFVNIDTDKWQQQFFILTLIIVVLLNCASAILSGSLFGIVGKFSPKYITATVGGQALGGIFAAIAQIISLAIGASSVHSAFVYFMVGNVLLFISFILYVVLSKTVFFKYHISDRMGIAQSEFDSDLLRPRIVNRKAILQKIWQYCVSIFLVFCISLSMYPAVTVLIESENKASGKAWNNVYFVPVISYLLFSLGDYLGRLFAGLIQKPRRGSVIIVLNVLRLIFIPLFLFCNAQPRSHLSIYFDKDYIYIIFVILFSLSNGYLANLTFMCIPRVVDHHEKETAASIMTVFLGIGLACGSTISLFIVKLL